MEKHNKNPFELVKMVKVIDGDTFIASDGRRVRLIGVDAPESYYRPEKYGNQAKTYTTCKLLGKSVWLQKDVSLRIVWLEKPDDKMNLKEMEEKMFNAQSVLDGFAEVTAYDSDVKYHPYFQYFTLGAKLQWKGLWGRPTLQ